jgi:aspartyl-tRNA(Asn)/glutamyl-tRNA(Gln) amidotransferase subunit A
MAGYDPLDPVSVDRTVPDFCDKIEKGVKELRLGLCEDFMATDIDTVVTKSFEETVKVFIQLGAQIKEVRFTEMDRLMKARDIIGRADLFSVHHERFANHPEGYGEDTRERIEAGRKIRLDEYIWAHREKELIRRSILDLFRSVDAFLLPTYPCVTGPIETEVTKVNGQKKSLRFIGGPLTSSHNFTGVPAIAVPSGFSPDGLPVSLQILGSPWSEGLLLRIAHAFEEATPEIRSRRPPVS